MKKIWHFLNSKWMMLISLVITLVVINVMIETMYDNPSKMSGQEIEFMGRPIKTQRINIQGENIQISAVSTEKFSVTSEEFGTIYAEESLDSQTGQIKATFYTLEYLQVSSAEWELSGVSIHQDVTIHLSSDTDIELSNYLTNSTIRNVRLFFNGFIILIFLLLVSQFRTRQYTR